MYRHGRKDLKHAVTGNIRILYMQIIFAISTIFGVVDEAMMPEKRKKKKRKEKEGKKTKEQNRKIRIIGGSLEQQLEIEVDRGLWYSCMCT